MGWREREGHVLQNGREMVRKRRRRYLCGCEDMHDLNLRQYSRVCFFGLTC